MILELTTQRLFLKPKAYTPHFITANLIRNQIQNKFFATFFQKKWTCM